MVHDTHWCNHRCEQSFEQQYFSAAHSHNGTGKDLCLWSACHNNPCMVQWCTAVEWSQTTPVFLGNQRNTSDGQLLETCKPGNIQIGINPHAGSISIHQDRRWLRFKLRSAQTYYSIRLVEGYCWNRQHYSPFAHISISITIPITLKSAHVVNRNNSICSALSSDVCNVLGQT